MLTAVTADNLPKLVAIAIEHRGAPINVIVAVRMSVVGEFVARAYPELAAFVSELRVLPELEMANVAQSMPSTGPTG